MPTQSIPLRSLHPAPYNPRLQLKPGDPAWNRLERSIREFSLVQPVVWNERTGHVVAGHQRVEVLKHLGHIEADCIVVNLPIEREKALNVTLNNANVASDWDPDRLTNLLQELHDLPDFDATLTGFDEPDLRDLLFTPNLNLPEEPDIQPQSIQITLEVPTENWPQLEPDLNQLLQKHNLQPHIQLPH